jgi:hypothetical protein
MKSYITCLACLLVLLLSASTARAVWLIDTYMNGSSITSLSTADSLIASTSPIASGNIDLGDFLGFNSGEGTGHFSINNPVAGITQASATDNYAVQGTGLLVVPSTGYYTFGLNTDDGARLRIDGMDIIIDDGIHPPLDSAYVTVSLTEGLHAIEWTWFNHGGGAEAEIFAASGSYTGFNSNFKLVGDTSGLAVVQVPEPETIVLLLVVCISLSAFAWRRRKMAA